MILSSRWQVVNLWCYLWYRYRCKGVLYKGRRIYQIPNMMYSWSGWLTFRKAEVFSECKVFALIVFFENGWKATGEEQGWDMDAMVRGNGGSSDTFGCLTWRYESNLIWGETHGFLHFNHDPWHLGCGFWYKLFNTGKSANDDLDV